VTVKSVLSTPTPVTMVGRERFLLLVVDEAVFVDELGRELDARQVDVVVCPDSAEGLLKVGTLKPNAVLAAAELRPVDSPTFVRVLREASDIPIVIGVGNGDGSMAAGVLAAGATACVARPYRPVEVLPILRSIGPDSLVGTEPTIQVGGLRLDPTAQEAYLNNQRIYLPMRECLLLRLLMRNADRLVTREQIIAAVWPNNGAGSSNTVNVHIQRLRARLNDDPHNARIIQTVRKKGYRLVPPPRRKRSATT
jgi:DNA-binding response OmpR family regulator